MIDINKILFYSLWVMFYLLVMIKKTMIFIFIPSKNFSVRLIQLITWGISICIILLLFHVSMEVIEVIIFLLFNLFYFSVNYWIATFVFYLNSRNDPIYIRNLKSNDFMHEIPQTNDVILEIQKIKKSIKEWAGNENKEQAIERLKLLRIFDKVSSDKKRFNFFTNSIITLILGLTASVILNKDIIKYLNYTNGATSIDENLINYANGVTILLLGLMYASKFLVLGHRINKKNELYEEILNSLILEIEEKKVETENNSSSNN
ncbi:hypothetical protein [Bacillus safensis]|uniref:hypothetical protein n=1 Tax=Bacillus safensis TaxID=561879 RepID=UPI003981F6CC